MLELVANFLLLAGVALLGVAAWTVRRLILDLPSGQLRRDWAAFIGFITLFIAGYLAYLVAFRGSHGVGADLIVPVVFFGGACFVVAVARLMRRTASDLRRLGTLERENVTDALTGLRNRRAFDRRWGEELARARRIGQPLAMLVVDVDHFKRINDEYGHKAGDAVLAAVARVLLEVVRETDIAARYGGEEFAVIAPYTRPEAAFRLAERVRQAVEERAAGALGAAGASRKVSVSIGVAGCDNAALSCERVFERADAALYAAKQDGRNRVVLAPAR
jgi:diguanylate cyclase (GGDEF)-like protein